MQPGLTRIDCKRFSRVYLNEASGAGWASIANDEFTASCDRAYQQLNSAVCICRGQLSVSQHLARLARQYGDTNLTTHLSHGHSNKKKIIDRRFVPGRVPIQ
jgi:hypothetical protein